MSKMKKTRSGKAVLAACAIAVSLGLTGCWEEVTEHTPGVYSGKSDQLTADPDGASNRAETLAKRFQLVQTDR